MTEEVNATVSRLQELSQKVKLEEAKPKIIVTESGIQKVMGFIPSCPECSYDKCTFNPIYKDTRIEGKRILEGFDGDCVHCGCLFRVTK